MLESDIVSEFSDCFRRHLGNQSVTDFALKTGMSKRMIYKYLEMEVTPGDRNMSKILTGLNITSLRDFLRPVTEEE